MNPLRPGDIFCTRNPMMLGRAINGVQKFWSKDNKSEYSHSGVIIDNLGTTFEALWTNKHQDFSTAYKGINVVIGRNKNMTPLLAQKGWEGVKHHKGKAYAGHRLLFFLIPPLAKYLGFGLGVCSELTMKYLCKAGLSDCWQGWNPDDVADMIHKWKEWEVIYEGAVK